jgi:hypothetical protein
MYTFYCKGSEKKEKYKRERGEKEGRREGEEKRR